MRKNCFLLAVLPVVLLSACSSDDDPGLSLNKSEISLYYEDEVKLTASDDVTWSSENEFVAKVSSNGVVKGGHVGKTYIVASNGIETAKYAVEVKPKYNTFVEPFIDFGASKSEIKSKEKRTLLNEQSTSLIYEDSKDGVIVMYLFDNEKMISSALGLNYK